MQWKILHVHRIYYEIRALPYTFAPYRNNPERKCPLDFYLQNLAFGGNRATDQGFIVAQAIARLEQITHFTLDDPRPALAAIACAATIWRATVRVPPLVPVTCIALANHAMILEKHTAVRIGRVHDGKVMVMRSNLRWCSDGLELTC